MQNEDNNSRSKDGNTVLTEGQVAEIRLNALRNICRSTFSYVYVFDVCEKKIVFASDSMYFLYGLKRDDTEESEIDIYKTLTPEVELRRMNELRIEAKEILNEKFGSMGKYFCFEFDLLLSIKGKEKLCHSSSVPFMYKKDGSVWMTLGMVSPISRKEAGEAILRIRGERTYYQYDFNRHKWMEKCIVDLNDKEKSVLTFSAQGFTEREIAKMMFKSHNSIKTYKRSLFRKLGVNSIAEALMYSLNNHLL